MTLSVYLLYVKKGTTKHYSLTPEIHFRIKIDDSTNLPNGNLSDILQATHLYAFSISGFFVLVCIDITLKGSTNNMSSSI